MYNKKVLIDSLKKLGSAKAPAVKKDFIVDPRGQQPYPTSGYSNDYPQMRSGGSKHNHVVVKPSKIEGADKGLFSNQGFRKDQLIGLAHRDGQPVGKIGNMHNHSDEPNMYSIKKGNERYVYAKRDIQPGEELTTDYRQQPELEQPEDFMRKGGSAPKLPKKKNSKAYSRSLEATNRLFAEHPFFAQPKSRKNKIYDPNAKYYAEGGLIQYAPGGDWPPLKKGAVYVNPLYMGNFVGGNNSFDTLTGENAAYDIYNPYSASSFNVGVQLPLSKSRRIDSEKTKGWMMDAYVGMPYSQMIGEDAKFLPSAGVKFDYENSPQNDPTYGFRKFRPFVNLGAEYSPTDGFGVGAFGGGRTPFGKTVKPGYGAGHMDAYAGFQGGLNLGKGNAQLSPIIGGRIKGEYEPNRKSFLNKVLGDDVSIFGEAGATANFFKGKMTQRETDDMEVVATGNNSVYGGPDFGTAEREIQSQPDSVGVGFDFYGNVGLKKKFSDFKSTKKKVADKRIQEIEDNEKRAFQESEVEKKEPKKEKPKKGCPEGEERYCADCPCEPIERVHHPRWLQDGGELDGMNGMMKARLAYANEFGNPAAKRMINLPDNPYQFENGNTGTHYMASIDNYAVPQIQDENGELVLGDYGPDSNEAIQFDRPEDAEYFAEHYKEVSPGFVEAELTPEEIEEYAKGGYIIEDISIPSLNKKQLGGLIKSGKNLLRGANIATIGTANTLAKNLAPVMINPARIPLLGSAIEKLGPFTGSPLNMLPGYGETMSPMPGTAFRKFGDTLDYVKMSGELNPAHGPLLRMGKNQIASEGNWAELNEPNEQYQGVFGAKFDFNNPGTNLGYTKIRDRNGVLINDAQGNPLPNIPISDPGLSFHRRLPFSNRYIDVDMDKLRNDQFDWRTVGGNAQSLLERYGYAAGYAGLLGAMGLAAPQEYIDEYINEPIMRGYNKYIKPGAESVYDFGKPKKYRLNKYGNYEQYAKGGSVPKAQLGKIVRSTKNIILPPTRDQRLLTNYVSSNFGPSVTPQYSAEIARRIAREQHQRSLLDAQQQAYQDILSTAGRINTNIPTIPHTYNLPPDIITSAIDSKISKANLDELGTLLKKADPSNLDQYFEYPFTINTPTGTLRILPNTSDIKDNLWHFNAFMNNQREAGLAFNYANKIFPYAHPMILEPTSLSLDSFGMLTNMGRRTGEWDMVHEGVIPLNNFAKNSNVLEGLPPLMYTGAGMFGKDVGEEYVKRLNNMISEKGLKEKVDWEYIPITGDSQGWNKFLLPNYRLTRKYSQGGLQKAQLGTIVKAAKTITPPIKPIIKTLSHTVPEVSNLIKHELPLLTKVNSATSVPAIHKFVPEVTQLDWAKWNKATPDFSKLMQEYSDIEEFTKGTGTWMKNADGTPYMGSPQQFIQEQSSYFKNAFPEGYETVFRGVNKKNAFADFNRGKGFSGDRGIFTANPELAYQYANYHAGTEPITLNPFVNDNVQGIYELIYPKGKQLIHDAQGADWRNVDILNNTTSNDPFELQRLNDYFGNLQRSENDVLMQNNNGLSSPFPRTRPGLLTTTDKIADYIPQTNLNSILLKNIVDGGFGNVTIVNNRPGNYLKSRIGNTGFFKMDNSHIYKSLGGESDYELGDEVDEATMKELKKLGYTFEKI
jgi:hypothetical protein